MKYHPQRDFGLRVRELRAQAGMTQEDLAERCGLFRTYLSRIETGVANPTLTMIYALATSLDVRVTDLLSPAPAGANPAPKGRAPSAPRAADKPRLSRGRADGSRRK